MMGSIRTSSLQLVLLLLTTLIVWSTTTLPTSSDAYLLDSSNSILKTKFALRQQQQQLSPSRCLNLCQNDQYCKSGQCILTECSDTVACYKYCMLCNNQLNCYQTGEFCSYNASSQQPKLTTQQHTKLFLVFLVIFTRSIVKQILG